MEFGRGFGSRKRPWWWTRRSGAARRIRSVACRMVSMAPGGWGLRRRCSRSDFGVWRHVPRGYSTASASGTPRVLAVMPFAVHGDSSYRFLRTALVELLSSNLESGTTLRAADARSVVAYVGRDASPPDQDRARDVAERSVLDCTYSARWWSSVTGSRSTQPVRWQPALGVGHARRDRRRGRRSVHRRRTHCRSIPNAAACGSLGDVVWERARCDAVIAGAEGLPRGRRALSRRPLLGRRRSVRAGGSRGFKLRPRVLPVQHRGRLGRRPCGRGWPRRRTSVGALASLTATRSPTARGTSRVAQR